MSTVKLEYGIFSGAHSGSKLEKALRKAGYTIVRNAADADIIMTHSAGCFWLPAVSNGKKLILIDPPYWPGKTVRDRSRSQRRANFHYQQYGYPFFPWFRRNLWGVYYAVRDLPRTIQIIRRVFKFNLEDIVRDHDQLLLVHNQYDTWFTPDFAQLKKFNGKLKTMELPGSHEDITHHPERYAELLQSFVKGEINE